MDNVLVLIRHGQSEWNQKNLFTGWKDVDLTEQGVEQARKAGQMLKGEGFDFDIAYTSNLIRAQRTLQLVMEELGQTKTPTIKHQDLNERDYGELAGLNKDEARAKWGDEKVHLWRRSFDIAPPNGESLKDTANRVIPYYNKHILPDILAQKNVIIAGHGNALRALVMGLEDWDSDQVTKYSIANGIPLIFQFDEAGKVISRRELDAAGVAA